MPDPRPIDTPRPNYPKAPEPTLRNQLNAFRHDLTGQLIVFTPDEQQAYAKHCKIILDHFAPVGAYERDITQSIADDRWRLKRARAIEAGTFALGMQEQAADNTGAEPVDDALAHARAWRQDAHNLHLLTIYEQRIQRSMEKNMAHLRSLQAERKQEAREAMEKAKLLYQLAEAQGKPYQPELYFTFAPEVRESVFSTTEIVRELTRAKLLNDADYYVRTGSLPAKNPSQQPVETSRNQAPPQPAARHSAVTV